MGHLSTTLYVLVMFKAQLGEPFLNILIIFCSYFLLFFWQKPALKHPNWHLPVKLRPGPKPALKHPNRHLSENSRRLWLFPGSVRGFSRKTPGKSRENCWKFFPESRNAINSRIWGTGKGQPAGNLGSTLPRPCPHLPCGMFLKIDSSSLLEFSELRKDEKAQKIAEPALKRANPH